MRVILVTILLAVFGCLLIIQSIAYTASYRVPGYAVDETALPEVSARAWGIFDADTGQLLVGKDVQSAYPIASVTKLMTAEVALDTLTLEATTTLSRKAIATEGRAGGLQVGEVFSVRELLFPLILSSSNDAAEALAEHGARDAFVSTMNATARRFDMLSTIYADPSGLSPFNVSSVADVAILLRHLADAREYLLDISRLQDYVYPNHRWRNVNKVAVIETYRGGKHGYTDEAGYTLAALFDEVLATGNTRSIALVLLGSDNLQTDVETLRGFLHSNIAYRHGEESFAIIRAAPPWNLPIPHSIENIVPALLPMFAVKSRL